LRLRERRELGAVPARANTGAKSFTGTNYGTWGTWPNSLFNRANYDPQRAVGNPLENSLVFAGLDWQATAFQEAPFVVKTIDAEGTESTVPRHPLSKLLKRPNPFWSRSRFWRATLLSRFLNGNAYWLKVRSAAGIVVELYWLPHRCVRPVVLPGATTISHYEYRAGGNVQIFMPEDIVHFRYGVDPDNSHLGFAPFRAIVRQVATDNEATSYEDILLHNMGVPAAVIRPKSDADEITTADGEKIRATWVARTSGGERGTPIVLPVPLDIDMPAISPNDFGLQHVHDHVESRFAMVMKVPAVILGVLVGLKHSTAKASYRDSANIGWRQNIIPTQEELTEDIDELLKDIGLGNPDTEYCAFDRREVEALQEDRRELSARTSNEFTKQICDRAEARGRLGYKVRPVDKDVWYSPKANESSELIENDNPDKEKQGNTDDE